MKDYVLRNFVDKGMCADQENAKMCRKDLADTINAPNDRLGIVAHWEHRSFKEQGIDREPTIHIGAVANALERKGTYAEPFGGEKITPKRRYSHYKPSMTVSERNRQRQPQN